MSVLTHKAPSSPEKLWVRVDREDRQLMIADIHYVEAFGNYVKIWLDAKENPSPAAARGSVATHALVCWLTASTLKQFVERLPSTHFVQIHKSWVVNRHLIAGIAADHVRLHSGQRLKLGHAFKAQVFARE